MKILTSKLQMNKNSSLEAFIQLEDTEELTGWRTSAYIKQRLSDERALAPLETKINLEDKTIRVYLPSLRAKNLPVGQIFYFVELFKGANRLVQYDYLDIYP